MNSGIYSCASMPRSMRMRMLMLALLVGVWMLQNPLPAAAQGRPAHRQTVAMSGSRAPRPVPAVPASTSVRPAPAPPQVPPLPSNRDTSRTNRPDPFPFSPGIGFGSLGGNRPAQASNRFGAGSPGIHPDNIASLFPDTSRRGNGVPGATGATTPNFTRIMRPGLSVPFNASFGTFRLSYRDMFGPGGNTLGSNPARGSGSAMFSTTSLGSGVVFSAGTSCSNRSTAASLSGVQGAPKHSGPSLALKLSF
jgi:hypothetical protein